MRVRLRSRYKHAHGAHVVVLVQPKAWKGVCTRGPLRWQDPVRAAAAALLGVAANHTRSGTPGRCTMHDTRRQHSRAPSKPAY